MYNACASKTKEKKKKRVILNICCQLSFSFLFLLTHQIGFALKIVAWTEKMVHKHPEMVSRIKIGTTVEDNPLYVLKVKIIQELLIFNIVEKHECKSYFLK